MFESKVNITHPIFCKSYATALEVSKAFEGFKFNFVGLGGIRVVSAKRRIVRNTTSKFYSHCVKVIFEIGYHGAFGEYGFLDERTKKKYPELISQLKSEDLDRRWKLIEKYQDYEDEECRDIYFYESFQDFFKTRLKNYLNKLFLAGTIAFSGAVNTSTFVIQYRENNIDYEFGYFAADKHISTIDVGRIGIKDVPAPILMSQVWTWMSRHYFNKKDKYFSEPRAVTALSYVLNRTAPEQLFYSILGIESIFTKDEHKVKSQLKHALPNVFPFISAEEVGALYKHRSEFAHGDLIFPMYYDNTDIGPRAIDYWESAQKVSGLLILSIRLLIKNDAEKILVDENGVPRYVRGNPLSDM